MPKVNVEIEWDLPNELSWLNPDNVALALHAYCKNTHFKVRCLTSAAPDRDSRAAVCATCTLVSQEMCNESCFYYPPCGRGEK
jgi:hypothetical protein